jgi:hypothetical protein
MILQEKKPEFMLFWENFLEMAVRNSDEWRSIFGKSSPFMQDILDNVTNSVALDRMYDWPKRKKVMLEEGLSDQEFENELSGFFGGDFEDTEFQEKMKLFIEKWGEWFWQEMVQTGAGIRLRKDNVFHIFDNFVQEQIDNGKQSIKILSLASGKGFAVLDTIAKWGNEIKFEVVFTDIDQGALEISKGEFEKRNLQAKADWIQADLLNPESGMEFKQQKWDVIQLVGFMDYLPNEVAVKFSGMAQMLLNEGGMFLTGSVVAPNIEIPFLENIIKWRGMHFRKQEEIEGILSTAGFDISGVEVKMEATGTHRLMVVKK